MARDHAEIDALLHAGPALHPDPDGRRFDIEGNP